MGKFLFYYFFSTVFQKEKKQTNMLNREHPASLESWSPILSWLRAVPRAPTAQAASSSLQPFM